jgi:hypothetical protein
LKTKANLPTTACGRYNGLETEADALTYRRAICSIQGVRDAPRAQLTYRARAFQ